MNAMAADSLTTSIAELRRAGVHDVLGALLARVADPRCLWEELGSMLDLPVKTMQALAPLDADLSVMPFTECARRRCALLRDRVDGTRHLLLTDPFDTDVMAWARSRFGDLTVSLASAETFDAWLTQCESGLSALGSQAFKSGTEAGPGVTEAGAEVVTLRHIGKDDSPAVRFVNSTLYDALRSGASDIHLECDPAGLNVKLRLDGVLTAVGRVDGGDLAGQAISRIKVLARLDIAERRVPQDGRLQVVYQSRPIDVRVSIMPSIHGEDAVLRVLDRQHLAETLSGLTLAKLGFDEPSASALRHLCRKPHGMLLVTGPTGSGKTTTLYAAIAETHQSRDKIITIEDPVEYQLAGVLQIPVNERKGLTFARGLRSILRHDPDKILVGEIRDAETAQIAVQSALTGHLVFTTVHANTAFDVVGRFEQFGIDAYTFASAINGVLAQRLVRRVCGRCATDAAIPAASAADEALSAALHRIGSAARVRQAAGCEHCRGTGYSGRFALGELLRLTPALKALISSRAPQQQIQSEAQRCGWRGLRELAMEAALQGHTTLEEVDRVAA